MINILAITVFLIITIFSLICLFKAAKHIFSIAGLESGAKSEKGDKYVDNQRNSDSLINDIFGFIFWSFCFAIIIFSGGYFLSIIPD